MVKETVVDKLVITQLKLPCGHSVGWHKNSNDLPATFWCRECRRRVKR